MESSVVKLAPLSDLVPKDVQEMVNARAEEIKAGKFTIFKGPIKKQDGTLAYQEGQTASVPELLKMDYFVEGIKGTIPK